MPTCIMHIKTLFPIVSQPTLYLSYLEVKTITLLSSRRRSPCTNRSPLYSSCVHCFKIMREQSPEYRPYHSHEACGPHRELGQMRGLKLPQSETRRIFQRHGSLDRARPTRLTCVVISWFGPTKHQELPPTNYLKHEIQKPTINQRYWPAPHHFTLVA